MGFSEFSKRIQKNIRVMKDNFNDDANKLTAHHASVMKDIRRDYTEEIAGAKRLRDEITAFQMSTDHLCREINDGLQSESRRIDALHRELVLDIEEIHKKR